jgi:hypothetical protein
VVGTDDGRFWATFDLRPEGGGPVERYAPQWVRGGTKYGQGDPAIVAKIKNLKAGDRVKVNWTYEHRKRALSIEKIE